MRTSKYLTLSAVALLASGVTAHLRANPIVQATLADWISATNAGYTTEDFSSLPGLNYVGPVLHDKGLTISAADNYLFGGNASTGWDIGSGEWLLTRSPVTITGPGGISSFSIDLSVYGTPGLDHVQVNTTDGSFGYDIGTPGVGSSAFFGFTLAAGETLDSVGISSGGQPVLDNISYGTAGGASVPDSASTLLLVSLGVSALAYSRKLRLA